MVKKALDRIEVVDLIEENFTIVLGKNKDDLSKVSFEIKEVPKELCYTINSKSKSGKIGIAILFKRKIFAALLQKIIISLKDSEWNGKEEKDA